MPGEENQYTAEVLFSCPLNGGHHPAELKFCLMAPTLGLAYIEAGKIAERLVPDLKSVLVDLTVDDFDPNP